MPTYDYLCPNGHRYEVFQKISDDPVAPCPECGAMGDRQISGGAGFLFKGEGFYITDYRSEDYKKKASAEAKDGGTSSGGSGGDGASKDGPSSPDSAGSGGASKD